MAKVKLVLIAAVSRNGVLSSGGKIPWHLPRDVAHFRQRAVGRWLLLGRTTFEQMSGWFQPGQVPLVLTRREGYEVSGGYQVASVEEALKLAAERGVEELLVCGGGQVYAAAFPTADEVILTKVDLEVEGDTSFPDMPDREWMEVSRKAFPADAENAQGMSILTYQRRTTSQRSS